MGGRRKNRTRLVSVIAIVAALAASGSGCGGATEAAGVKPLCRQSVAAPQYRRAISSDRALLPRLNRSR